jgi:hypothetical protein
LSVKLSRGEKEMKKTVIALSTAMLLAAPLKASAFDIGGILGGSGGDLLQGSGLSQDLISKIDIYTQIGKTLLSVVRNKSLDSLFSALPGILGKLGADGALMECSDPSIDCEGLIGDAGTVDWESASKTIQDSVYASAKDADGLKGKSAISSGLTDVRFRPRITTQLDNTKIATWTQVQNAQYQAVTGKSGQKAIKESRKATAKIVEDSIDTATDIGKLDNTQDILKTGEYNRVRAIALQKMQLSEQEQIKLAQYDGNQTANEQLSIQQKVAWEEEVGKSQALLSANAEGDAFSDFITSAYTVP